MAVEEANLWEFVDDCRVTVHEDMDSVYIRFKVEISVITQV